MLTSCESCLRMNVHIFFLFFLFFLLGNLKIILFRHLLVYSVLNSSRIPASILRYWDALSYYHSPNLSDFSLSKITAFFFFRSMLLTLSPLKVLRSFYIFMVFFFSLFAFFFRFFVFISIIIILFFKFTFPLYHHLSLHTSQFYPDIFPKHCLNYFSFFLSFFPSFFLVLSYSFFLSRLFIYLFWFQNFLPFFSFISFF